jgi:hypothetical protein
MRVEVVNPRQLSRATILPPEEYQLTFNGAANHVCGSTSNITSADLLTLHPSVVE